MTAYTSRTAKQPKSKKGMRAFLFILLILAVLVFAVFSLVQYLSINNLQKELETIKENLADLSEENSYLKQRYDEISEENEKLRQDNHMLRSSNVISYGRRETSKVAITIDDGAGPELVEETLKHLREGNVKATFFPMGSWVERHPEIWAKAVKEGHELGNHTYSHAFLTTISEERVKEELGKWQEAVDQALGYSYNTFFFRPPGMDGFTSLNSNKTKQLQTIIADHGMVPILWDVELVYALRNEIATTSRITQHVLSSAGPGSIVLLHFTPNDIEALPGIISGLRSRGLEPCSLRELLLDGFAEEESSI